MLTLPNFYALHMRYIALSSLRSILKLRVNECISKFREINDYLIKHQLLYKITHIYIRIKQKKTLTPLLRSSIKKFPYM